MATFTPDGQMYSEWHIRRGATFIKPYTWSTGEPPTLVPLSTWKGRAQIREKETSETVLANLTTENGKIVLTDNGEITIRLEAEDTAALLVKQGVFDLELEDPATGFVRNLVGGPVILYGNVTRPIPSEP